MNALAMLLLLATYYRKASIRYFRRERAAKLITVSLFLLVIGLFAVVVHIGFYSGFKYVMRDEFFGEAVSLYVIELFFLIASVLMFASALMSGLMTLFRPEDGAVIMASPRYSIKPWLAFARMFFSSLWPLLVVIVPALLACVRVLGLSLPGFLLALFASILLVALAVLLALLSLFATASLLSALRIFSKRTLLIANTSVFLFVLFMLWERFHAVDLVRFFQARLLTRATADLLPILDQFAVFPSHWVAMVIYYGERGMHGLGLLALGSLVLFTLALFGLLLFALRRYLLFWQIAQEHPYAAVRPAVRAKGAFLIARTQTVGGALFIKETLLFFRNPRGMLWVGFILVIWGMQVASTALLTHGLHEERVSGGAIPPLATALQFALVVYFIVMFALRFAFPSFSEEQKSAWVVESAPLPLVRVFTAKWCFFSALFVLLATIFTLFNISILGLSPTLVPGLFVMVVASVLTVTTFALSLGALFPNMETDDPEALSTTLPGLSFIASALLYGGIGAFLLRSSLLSGSFLLPSLFVLLSLFALIVPLFFARRALKVRYLA